MILIYGKGKVGSAVAALCEYVGIAYDIEDDTTNRTSFGDYDMIIPSPGVPGTHPLYQTGKVVAELDFAYQYLPKHFCISAVTGTDGKSTTTWILASILQKEFFGKKPVYISGNFDTPFSETVLDILKKGEKKGEIVIEVSSFMSYWIGKSSLPAFTPDYTIFTNFKTDHQNWHRNLQEYLDAKVNLLQHTLRRSICNQEVVSFAHENGLTLDLAVGTRFFSDDKALTPKDWTNGEDIALSGRRKYHLSDTNFSGKHNALNILSVTLVTNEMGICSKRTRTYLREITGLAHRIEIVGSKGGITFVDDSKSTSAQSLEAALSAFGKEKNLLLIVGGSDKGDTFEHLAPLFLARVKSMVCIGTTKEQFIKIAQENRIPYKATDSLGEGVEWLSIEGKKGDILMLSPGCASFGLFRDYLDRANQFREAIKNLPS